MILEKRTYTIEVLTPVHVGSGEKRPRFLLTWDGGKIYVLDLYKLSEAVFRRAGDRGIQILSDTLSTRPKEDVKKILSDIYKNEVELKSILERAKEYELGVGESVKGKGFPIEIITHVRTQAGEPYIPGSTIKGALRTAFAYVILKRLKNLNPRRFEEVVVKKIYNQLTQLQQKYAHKIPSKEITRFASWLEQLLFRSISPEPNTSLSENGKGDIHNDILRVLRISDTTTLPRDACVLEMVGVIKGRSFTGIDICVETIPKGSRLTFTITVDWALFNKFKTSKSKETVIPDMIDLFEEILEDPLKYVQEFSEDILRYEDEVVNLIAGTRIYSNWKTEQNVLHLGYGGTFLTKTINLLLNESLREEILRVFKNRRASRQAPVPSSRRLLQDKTPLGWVKLTRIS